MNAQSERVLSIDALRGFDMFWILGLDALACKMHEAGANPFTSFFKTQMTHVGWTGFHFYDLIMPLFYLIVDVWKFQKWTFPFIVIGSNAILAYLVSHLMGWRMAAIANVALGGLGQWTGAWQPALETAGGIALIYALLHYFYQRKIFLKI